MKISISSYSFAKYMDQTGAKLTDICAIASELGFEGIEFTGLPGDTQEERLALARELRQRCQELSLPIVAYAVGANLLKEDSDSEIKMLFECVDVCFALGAPVMRHDVTYSLPKKPLYSYRDAIKEMVPHIRKVTQYAKEKGIITCTENHGFVFQSPNRVEELILAVNDSNYGWLCDIGNFLCADEEPSQAVAVAAPYAVHAHVKDFLRKSEGKMPPQFFRTVCGNYLRGTTIGHGVVPVEKCIGILKKAGYDGWLSVEFEGSEDNIGALKSGIAFLKDIV